MKSVINKDHNDLQFLQSLEQIIFNLNKNNIDLSTKLTLNLFNEYFPFSFLLVISNFVCSAFDSGHIKENILFSYLKGIEIKQKEHVLIFINRFFCKYLRKLNANESLHNYLLEKMIEEKIIKPNFVKTLDTLYFAHYKTSEEIDELLKFGFHGFEGQFYRNIDELSKDNWKLHKQLISDGINPNEILKILRNDKIEKLMEISAQSNFDYNQGIEPSVYERCSFINYYVGLIDYAAFFGSIKCFKYLLINGANVEYTLENAVAGGNLEIIHLCEQNNASYKYIYETAIEFHRNEIFHYFYDNKVIEIEDLTGLGKICIQYNNYEIFSFLKEEGMEINEKIIKAAAKLGNIYFIENYSIYPKDLLIYAVKSGNTELVELLLKQKEIDVNAKIIFLKNL